MGTLICSERSFAFVHIPKCAGMLLTEELKNHFTYDPRFMGVKLDAVSQRHRYMQHPALGEINAAHIPIPLLELHFPDAYEKIYEYDAIAVTRDPSDRFQSAVSQHLREFHKLNIYDVDKETLGSICADCIMAMRRNPLLPGRAFIHFIRQVDFVRGSQGRTIVENIYGLGELDRLTPDINAKFGTRVEATRRKNKTRRYSSKNTRRLLSTLSRVSRTILPRKIFTAVRSSALSIHDTLPNKSDASIFNSEDFKSEIYEFYAEDAELYRQSLTPRASASYSHSTNS